MLLFRLKNRKITFKIVKLAKSGIREYFVLRNINVFEVLSAQIIDSNDFFARVIFAIHCLHFVRIIYDCSGIEILRTNWAKLKNREELNF